MKGGLTRDLVGKLGQDMGFQGMTIGVVGGGQLGRMLALSGYPLGFRFRFLDPNPESPAADVGDLIIAPYDDLEVLERFCSGLDVVTYEFENVPAETAMFLETHLPVYPSSRVLQVSQDRLIEKNLFRKLGLLCPDYIAVDSKVGLEESVARVGVPCILKSRRMGYDGKGQYVLRSNGDINQAWNMLGGVSLVLEEFVPFIREISIIALRDSQGKCEVYPLVQNSHREGILRFSLPLPKDEQEGRLAMQSKRIAESLLSEFDYRGVLTIETFEKDGQLILNEIAPRVHNSGHWTIEGAETSQFRNHLLAISGFSLGSCALRGHSAMINLIGDLPDIEKVMQIEGVNIHLYRKTERPGRKIGHLTVWADSSEQLGKRLEKLSRVMPEVIAYLS